MTMASSSSFRNSRSIFQPCITMFRRPQLRRHFFSGSKLPSSLSPHLSRNGDPSTSFKWFSGIIITGSATAGAAAALYYCSFSTQSHSLSHGDSSETPSVTAVTGSPISITTDDDDKKRKHKPRFLFGDAYRRRIFFNYEKRIRLRSPPEKVFEYFASVRYDDGRIFMTSADLMRSVVPLFPPSESNLVRDGYLRGERSPGDLRCVPSEFFMLFDTNNDSLISFKEYIFFVTLMSIPESRFSMAFKTFDLDSNGEIDRDEFKKVMALMRAQHRQGIAHRDGRRAGHRIGGGSVENGGLLEYFFGKDGEKCLHHDTFVQFLKNLHEEMQRLEFAHYDYKLRGTISAKDFALSMVASANLNELHKLLNRVDKLDHEPRLKNIRVTFEEFKDFAELRRKLQSFSSALFSFGKEKGLLTRDDLKQASSQVCGISLTDDVIEIIFHMFDANGDGNLSYDEFVKVLKQPETAIPLPTESRRRQ